MVNFKKCALKMVFYLKTLLHEFEEYDINKLFVHVGYDFKNINTSDDYHSLIKTKRIDKSKR